jgi:hypothetical protein
LRHVFVHLDVRVGRAFAEAFDRAKDDARVKFANSFPGEAHPIHRAWREILDQDVGLADEPFQNRFAFGRLGVQ